MPLHRVVTALDETGRVTVSIEYAPTVGLLPVVERGRIIEEALLAAAEAIQLTYERETSVAA